MSNIKDNNSVVLKDFCLINQWQPDHTGRKWMGGHGMPQKLIDMSTGRKYLNEEKSVVGFKCFLLTFGTIPVHAIASVINIALRIVTLVTFADFWLPGNSGRNDLKSRAMDYLENLLKIASAPLVIIALELSAIFGMVMPYDGRKLYASFERWSYGSFILAPCFQPDPTSHLFGGDINRRNEF